jgi:hypothetical protein
MFSTGGAQGYPQAMERTAKPFAQPVLRHVSHRFSEFSLAENSWRG